MAAGCTASRLRSGTTRENAAPEKFRASIGGFLGPSYTVELDNGVLKYFVADSPVPEEKVKAKINPSSNQWSEFRQSLDDLRVWQWQANYPNRGTYDGTQWSLDIVYSDHAIQVSGDNNYPTSSGKPNEKAETTETFERFLTAVQTLLGGKDFK